MHLFAVIFFTFLGLAFVTFGLLHELTWWKRRGWMRTRGTIVGYSEVYDDSLSYHPEIEFSGPSGRVRVVSAYGSGRKPELGQSVDIVVSESGEMAEVRGISNRILFTIIPISIGAALIFVGFRIEPVQAEKRIDTGKGPTVWESRIPRRETSIFQPAPLEPLQSDVWRLTV